MKMIDQLLTNRDYWDLNFIILNFLEDQLKLIQLYTVYLIKFLYISHQLNTNCVETGTEPGKDNVAPYFNVGFTNRSFITHLDLNNDIVYYATVRGKVSQVSIMYHKN